MTPLDLVTLSRVTDVTSGSSTVKIGLIDGPVALDHPELDGRRIRELPAAAMARASSPTALLACTARLSQGYWQERDRRHRRFVRICRFSFDRSLPNRRPRTGPCR